MPGKGKATSAGTVLENKVVKLAENIGLVANRQVRVGRRIWGAVRKIDLIVGDGSGRRLGIDFNAGGPFSDVTAGPLSCC